MLIFIWFVCYFRYTNTTTEGFYTTTAEVTKEVRNTKTVNTTKVGNAPGLKWMEKEVVTWTKSTQVRRRGGETPCVVLCGPVWYCVVLYDVILTLSPSLLLPQVTKGFMGSLVFGGWDGATPRSDLWL